MNREILPGVSDSRKMTPEQEAQLLLTAKSTDIIITKKDIQKATTILTEYKKGKSNLEQRIIQDEQWYKLRHWDVIKGNNNGGNSPQPSSAWLFNSIVNKHADAMDNFPEPIVLPREKSDEDSAKILSEVLPVILDYNKYDEVYSENWWEKLKHGTACYGIFWNSKKENGLGDIDIQSIDLLKLFWEPGIKDIQKSRNLFIVDTVDTDLLEQQYPELKGKLSSNTIDVATYVHDESIDTTNKSVVVDWYYKKAAPNGKTLVHYVKFVGDNVLYATENDSELRFSGLYEHGLYPIVLDILFPEKDMPVGFGYVSICKDPQLYIDKLSANILESSLMNTKKRFFVSDSTDINEDEFLDWSKPLIHVTGELSDRRIQEVVCRPLDNVYLSVMQQKIEEMKDTASNRDFNSGGSSGGITAASAIAALQEAGNKVSRDMISASYRVHIAVNKMCIELIRQFYDETRSFRIVADNNSYEFIDMSNKKIKDQVVGQDISGANLYRHPVFDLKIKAQRRNPFSRMEQNERAKELYAMGFFMPDKAQESLIALEMMDFEGIDKVKEQVQQGQTMMNMVQQMQSQIQQLTGIIQELSGAAIREPVKQTMSIEQQGASTSNSVADGIMAAQRGPGDYTKNLLNRTKM